MLSTAFTAYCQLSDGVSRQLAEGRSASVSDVSYDLWLSIPDSLAQPVTGHATVSFKYSGDDDLPLDFTGRLLKNNHNAWCEINGENSDAVQAKDEHIILPRRLLRKGMNTVKFNFVSGDASLNRHVDYMYTLFVPANARSCFPCFDQPDLKARFSLELKCPDGWTTVSSADSHPIPTYLFSFVAGKFQKKTVMRDGREMTALYRETDPQKVAQLDKAFDEAAYSIRWLEKYTDIKYPFDKYNFVVLPGYQFGGMEHPGAIQFTDREIFLGTSPTPDEELARLELIAHETAHMWFGDLVTMRWFNDVWTKEVFANFLADKISREVYPDINHDLNFLKSYQRPALAVDRTDGTHPIQQPLDNLKNAGLLYGNIIYDKAPVMMRKLEEQTGAVSLRDGLRAYLRKYSYGNATWDDLIGILDSVSPQARLKEFSEVWVKQKGLPTITATFLPSKTKGGADTLIVRQKDPWGRGQVWRQCFAVGIGYGGNLRKEEVVIDKEETRLLLPSFPAGNTRKGKKTHVYPNIDGRGYGRFIVNDGDMEANAGLLTDSLQNGTTAAYAALLNLHENYLMGSLSGRRFFGVLATALSRCANPLTGSTIVSSMETVCHYAPDSLRHAYERQMLSLASSHNLRPVRQQLLRSLLASATDKAVVDSLYETWLQKAEGNADGGLLTTRDYTRLAWHQAIVLPGKASNILSRQRTMLGTDDERREFDYVSRACTADSSMQKRLFYSLLPKEGRMVEPWARQMLSMLCDHLREPLCNSYIRPGLDNLLAIQQTSDIFFPGHWLSSLLSSQRSAEAQATVSSWIAAHPAYPQSLMNKLLQAAYPMFCSPAE